MKRMYYNDIEHTAWDKDGNKWRNVHPKSSCEGTNCCIHNPSKHKMVKWPRHLRETGLVERICKHGIGHPDPDSARWLNENDTVIGRRGSWGVHGCDGCCF